MLPTLSQVCSLPAETTKQFEDYSAGKCATIELWLTKVEDFLARHSPDELRRLLETNGLTAPVASYQGGLFSQGERRVEAWKLFTRRLDLCRELGVNTLVVAIDTDGPLNEQLLGRVQLTLQQAAEEAAKRSLRLALEFQASATFGNNLQTAAALVAETGAPNLGLCLDVFEWYVGPSKTEDLGYLTQDNLFHVQLSDLADTPRELAGGTQRILPGDGDLNLPAVTDRLHEIDFAGTVSLEILNPDLWQVPPLQMGEIGMTALRKTLRLT